MVTVSFKIDSTRYAFVDNCAFQFSHRNNTLEININGTTKGSMDLAYKELYESHSVSEIGIYTSGFATNASFKFVTKTVSDPAYHISTRNGVTTYSLSFTVNL